MLTPARGPLWSDLLEEQFGVDSTSRNPHITSHERYVGFGSTCPVLPYQLTHERRVGFASTCPGLPCMSCEVESCYGPSSSPKFQAQYSSERPDHSAKGSAYTSQSTRYPSEKHLGQRCIGYASTSGSLPYTSENDCEPQPSVQEVNTTSSLPIMSEWQGEQRGPAFDVGLHQAGGCRPCGFFRRKGRCKDGGACTFCHLSHEELRARPSKAKREKCKAMAEGMRSQGLAIKQGEFQPAPGESILSHYTRRLLIHNVAGPSTHA